MNLTPETGTNQKQRKRTDTIGWKIKKTALRETNRKIGGLPYHSGNNKQQIGLQYNKLHTTSRPEKYRAWPEETMYIKRLDRNTSALNQTNLRYPDKNRSSLMNNNNRHQMDTKGNRNLTNVGTSPKENLTRIRKKTDKILQLFKVHYLPKRNA